MMNSKKRVIAPLVGLSAAGVIVAIATILPSSYRFLVIAGGLGCGVGGAAVTVLWQRSPSSSARQAIEEVKGGLLSTATNELGLDFPDVQKWVNTTAQEVSEPANPLTNQLTNPLPTPSPASPIPTNPVPDLWDEPTNSLTNESVSTSSLFGD